MTEEKICGRAYQNCCDNPEIAKEFIEHVENCDICKKICERLQNENFSRRMIAIFGE